VNSRPGELAFGPDGALWFTESSAGKVGRITEFDVPGPVYGALFGMISGPDRSLWFGDGAEPLRLGRITPTGQITWFTFHSLLTGHPFDSVTSPDGALWFTFPEFNAIGRITLGGAISVFAVPTPDSGPSFLTAGPGGTIWFTEQLGNKIARLSPPKPSVAQERNLVIVVLLSSGSIILTYSVDCPVTRAHYTTFPLTAVGVGLIFLMGVQNGRIT